HERDLQVTLADLRGSGGQQPVGAMHQRFMALLEQYPNLKGNDVIVDLNNRIVAVENQLQYARTGFNAVTQQYNSRVKQFPEIFLAKIMRLVEKPYFQLQHASEGIAVDVGALLKTSAEKKSEQAQREEEAIYALVSDDEIIIATLVCLMAVDGNIGKKEYQYMLQVVSTSQPNLDMPELRKLAEAVLEQIKNESLNSVLSATLNLAQRLAGTEIGKDLIHAMNLIAEADAGVEAAEQAIIDRFRDTLGGQ
ncbi:MAG: LemA family protein, partial [Pirellulaceae bacterium]|nr:LemA family protein [Pirellulaceae bacterium]